MNDFYKGRKCEPRDLNVFKNMPGMQYSFETLQIMQHFSVNHHLLKSRVFYVSYTLLLFISLLFLSC